MNTCKIFCMTRRFKHICQLFIHANIISKIPLEWRHNDNDGVSKHQPRDCLLNRYSGTDQRKHQSSASLAFAREFTVDKGPVTRRMFPFDDVIMANGTGTFFWLNPIQVRRKRFLSLILQTIKQSNFKRRIMQINLLCCNLTPISSTWSHVK